MSSKQVSIVIVTYNSSWERVRATVNSAMMQKGIDFEIVVSDDGSADNYFKKIEVLFHKYEFTNYRLIPHVENQGIVLNFLDAVEQSRGEYIRGIGQGDMFFDEYTVRDSYKKAVTSGADVVLSKAVCYRKHYGAIELVPRDSWTPLNDRKALGNRDYIRFYRLSLLGASTFYKRDTLLTYLSELAGRIKYNEDHAVRLMALDDRKIFFIERNTVYYEVGPGISTSGNDWSSSALRLDQKAYSQLLLERLSHRSDLPWVEKLKLLINVEYKKGFIPFLDRETVVDLLYKLSPEEFTKQCNRLYKIRGKYPRKMSLWDKIRCGVELFTVPEMFFRILKGKLLQRMNRVMTDTNVSTAFAELCMSRE